MMPDSLKAQTIATGVGVLALLLFVGSLTFEYGFGYRPCELCLTQRFFHLASMIVGLAGGAALYRRLLPAGAGWGVAALAALLIGISGAVGFYQAGVEWHIWAGPAACTGHAFVYAGGALNLAAQEGPRCDVAQWRLFGISMAGYNALISLPAAILAFWALRLVQKDRTANQYA